MLGTEVVAIAWLHVWCRFAPIESSELACRQLWGLVGGLMVRPS